MTLILILLLNCLTSFIASMAAFVIWVHYDLNGYWEQKHHERAIRRERQKEPRPFEPRKYARLFEPDGVRPGESYRQSRDGLDKQDGTR